MHFASHIDKVRSTIFPCPVARRRSHLCVGFVFSFVKQHTVGKGFTARRPSLANGSFASHGSFARLAKKASVTRLVM